VASTRKPARVVRPVRSAAPVPPAGARPRFAERHDVPRLLLRAGAVLVAVAAIVLIGIVSVKAFRDRDAKAKSIQKIEQEAATGMPAVGPAAKPAPR
jgi:hypothetical protein